MSTWTAIHKSIERIGVPEGQRLAARLLALKSPKSFPQSMHAILLTTVGTSPYSEAMEYQHLITIEPGKRGGKPCIRGLRITVSDVLEYLASGMSEDEILRDFPDLTREDIRACLAFAADRERRLTAIPTK